MMKKNRNYSLYIVVGFLILSCTLIYWSSYSETALMPQIKTLGIICILSLMYVYISWYKCGGTMFNGYIIYITAFFAFNLGQPILQVFDYVDDRFDLLDPYNQTPISMVEYFNSAFMGLFFIIVMHLGGLYALSRSHLKGIRNSPNIAMTNTTEKFLAIRKVSFWIIIISFPFWAYVTYLEVSYTAIYGYGAEFYAEVKSQNTGIIKLLGDIFEPAILCYYFSSEFLKKNRWVVILSIVVTLILPPLMVGGRSQAVIAAAMILIIYSLFNPIKWNKLIIIGLGVYIMLNIVFVVKKTRNMSSPSIDTYKEILLDKDNSPVSGALSEMGHSMFPMAATMDMVPKNEGYRYGSTYLWAFTSIIPNIGFGDKHPAQKYANLGNWLMEKLRLNFGPGYSIAAEAYINFGIFGFVFFLFFGYYMAKYCVRINNRDVLIKPFLVIGILIFLWFSIKTVRNSFVGMVRAFFYYALFMSWLFKYYYLKHYSHK